MSDRTARHDRKEWLIALAALGLATFAGLLLRLHGIGKLDLWYDELALWFYTLTGDAVVMEAPHEPPLMAALLYALMWWMQDTAAIWSHLLPVALGTLTIPLAYLLASRLDQKPATCVIVAALVTLSPMAVYFSREARPYALLILVTAALYLAFLSAYTSRRTALWGLYGLLLALACLSHVGTSMIITALGVTTLILLVTDLRGPGGLAAARSWFVPFMVASVVGAAAGSWWMLERRDIAAANGYTFTYAFIGPYTHGTANFLREIFVDLGPGPVRHYAGVVPWSYSDLLGAIFVVLSAIGLARLAARGQRAAALLLGLAVAVPAVMLYLTTGHRTGIRYVSHAVVPYLALVGIGAGAILDRIPTRTLKAVAALALLGAMLPLSLKLPEVRPEIGRYRESARYIQTHAHELRGVLVLPYMITQYDADLRITNIYGLLKQDTLPLYHVSFGKIVGVKAVPGRFGLGTVLLEDATVEPSMPSGRYAVLSRRPFRDCQVLAESLALQPAAGRSVPIVEGFTVCDFTFPSSSAPVKAQSSG